MDHRDLNCFVRLFEDQQGVNSSGPLHDTTFATKDSVAVQGYPVSFGLKNPPILRAERDAAIVALLKSQGARLVASTNLDEACLSYFGENNTLGRVINFTYPECLALGSSSGSASAVAAKLVTFALGSDFGGSIRAPAAACGVYGLKTTPGILSGEGALLYDSRHDTLGFLAHSAQELETIVRALRFEVSTSTTPVRFIVPNIKEISYVDKLTCESFLTFIDALSKKFQVLTGFSNTYFERAQAIRKITAPYQIAKLLRTLGIKEDELSLNNRALYALGGDIKTPQFERALKDAHTLALELKQIFADSTVILTPTLPVRIPKVSDLKSLDYVPLNYLLTLANIGEIPAISFPSPQDRRFSIHAMGAPGTEVSLSRLPILLN